MAETRQRILDTARAMFNERGVHRVGVRELARELGVSPGNLAYHFSTKDSLVAELVRELAELNNRTIFAELPADFSVVVLYRSAVAVMRNSLGYRFVLLSYADAVMASPDLMEVEAAFQVKRRRRSETMMEALIRNGYVDRRAFAARASFLYEQAEMISSGWLTADALRPGKRSDEAVVLHYAKLGCALIEPFCTPKGARQMQHVLAGKHDEGLWASVEARDVAAEPLVRR